MFAKIKEHIKFLKSTNGQADTLRLLGDYIKSPARLPKPEVITISPFDFCNLRCRMCDIWRHQKDAGYKQNIPKIKQFLADVNEYFGSDLYIGFSGGELFQDDIIFDLLSEAGTLGFRVRLDTNATLLDDQKIARLKSTGVREVNISIDGFKGETHDSIRGVEGSHKKTMEAIGKLHAAGINVGINTVMMKENIDEIVSLIKFVTGSESMSTVNLLMIMPTDFQRARSYHPALYPQGFRSDAMRVLDEIILLKQQGAHIYNPARQLERYKRYLSDPEKFVKKECDMGLDLIMLDAHMNLHICPFVQAISMDGRKISDVWESVELRYIYSIKKQCRKNCMPSINVYSKK